MKSKRSCGRISLVRVVVVAVATMVCVQWPARTDAEDSPAVARSSSPVVKRWDATAPGRVESRFQESRITSPVPGRIAQVLVKANDKVFTGDLLVRLDDEEALARVAGAEAQVAMRERARDGERRAGTTERRRAEDAVADAETDVTRAQSAFDKAATARRTSDPADPALNAARTALARARDRLREQQEGLRLVKANAPLPTRLEGELNVARADLALARATLEKSRIRAPFAGTVLQVNAKVGEVAAPSPEQPLIVLGDVSALRVRAELDEREVSKVRVGQRVSVRAHPFRDREFEGKVQSIAKFVAAGRMTPPGPRNKLTDFDVLEVVVDLTDPGPLVVGMQVDVYFSSDSSPQQGQR